MLFGLSIVHPHGRLAARFYSPGIDISSFSDDVAALIDALRPGEELAVTRAGHPIATITGTGGALRGEIIPPSPPQEDTGRPRTSYDDVTVVATAMKLPDAARAALSDQLGSGYIVVDMQSAPATAEVLLVPPISPQLIGHLRSMFPQARIVAAEFEDRTLGISYLGAIRRMLDAGAETYLTSSTIPQLAEQLDRVVIERPQLSAEANSSLEIEHPRNGWDQAGDDHSSARPGRDDEPH